MAPWCAFALFVVVASAIERAARCYASSKAMTSLSEPATLR